MMQCPFCTGLGQIPEPFVTLFHAWQTLHDVVQTVTVPPNMLRHIRRTQDMLTKEARALRLDLDTSIQVIRQDLEKEG